MINHKFNVAKAYWKVLGRNEARILADTGPLQKQRCDGEEDDTQSKDTALIISHIRVECEWVA